MAKRRANGEGTLRKRDNGVWEGRFSANGEQHSVYSKSQSVVRKKMVEAFSDIENDEFLIESDETLEAWLSFWQDTFLDDVKQSSAERYKSCIRTHIIPVLGKICMADLKPSAIQKFLNDCKNKNGLSKKSVQNIRLVLSKALDKAVDDERIKKNPCIKTKVPAYNDPQKEMRPIKDDEIAAFLEAISGNEFENLFYVALFTGMRESEIIGLSWDCIDFEKGTVHLYRQFKRARGGDNCYTFSSLKNKQSRTFSVPKNVLDVLKKVRLHQSEQKLCAGTSWANKENLVFTNALGEHVHTKTVYRRFKKIASDIGIPDLRFHDLRHSYATLALENGVDPKTVSTNLGHATVAFTLDKYGHVSQAMMDDSASKMQRFIESL